MSYQEEEEETSERASDQDETGQRWLRNGGNAMDGWGRQTGSEFPPFL